MNETTMEHHANANTAGHTRPLAGRHVMVVGGTSGIGLAVARDVASAGAEVTLVGRDPQRLRRAAGSIGGARQLVGDLHDASVFEALFDALPPLDHLVITAGTASLKTLRESTPDDWRRVAEERIVGPLAIVRAALNRLRQDGSIVLTSGLLASRPMHTGAVIGAGVAAVEAMVRALSLELAPIRVNAVSPGLVDTPLLDTFFGDGKHEALASAAAALPTGRIGRPDDIAQAVRLLLTGGFITGEVLHLDGGARWA
ncbi:SDR family oxidoreductase [Paraburkholderia sp. J12]|uniref:SDR family oxidoreductase n=1 Tax=Paraburkholderia sp. J12 TaxID=2805432 RepID=UPI002ABDEA1B|nr:SDR family oxidoreductase [Paraburkholderia sp. J12]